MSMDEDSVRYALSSLQEKRLAGPAGGADSRVTKYEHRLQEVFNFDRRETAIVCVLLLRGAQTPGELRGRGERLYRFDTLDDVQSTLQKLTDRGLVKVLARQPGTKESRYVHLFAGDVPDDATQALPPTRTSVSAGDHVDARITALESEVRSLKDQISDLRRELSEFKQQF